MNVAACAKLDHAVKNTKENLMSEYTLAICR